MSCSSVPPFHSFCCICWWSSKLLLWFVIWLPSKSLTLRRNFTQWFVALCAIALALLFFEPLTIVSETSVFLLLAVSVVLILNGWVVQFQAWTLRCNHPLSLICPFSLSFSFPYLSQPFASFLLHSSLPSLWMFSDLQPSALSSSLFQDLLLVCLIVALIKYILRRLLQCTYAR